MYAIVVLLPLALLGCGAPQPAAPAVPEDLAAPPDTTLGPGDVFDVRVYGEEDLSSTFRIASDGSIDYPLLGTLDVAGKTPTEVAQVVEQGLRDGDFLKQPQVSILVKEYNSKKISVFGQVKKPGTFPYQDGMTVVEAISKAGGFNAMARKNDAVVIRVVDGTKRRFTVPVKAIGEGRAANFVLRPGDIVFVPERIF